MGATTLSINNKNRLSKQLTFKDMSSSSKRSGNCKGPWLPNVKLCKKVPLSQLQQETEISLQLFSLLTGWAGNSANKFKLWKIGLQAWSRSINLSRIWNSEPCLNQNKRAVRQ